MTGDNNKNGKRGASTADHLPAAPASGASHQGQVEALESMVHALRRQLSNEGRWRSLWKWRSLFLALVAVGLGLLVAQERRAHQRQQQPPVHAGEATPPWFNLHSHHAPRPGLLAAQRGLKPKYNVVLIPGFVTSGLELWSGNGTCAEGMHFRQRVWGGVGMPRVAGTQLRCWMKLMQLDPATGLDPKEGFRLRAMQGYESINYFVPGFIVWAAIINALSDVGYTASEMHPASYDWRLPMHLLEQRDGYFTKLKRHIEASSAWNGRKAMLIGHSFGANVALNFLYWAEGVQPGWVDAHVEHFVNVAGPLMGVAKSVTALLSGQMRDTVELGLIVRKLMDAAVTPEERAALMRTWGSVVQMLPVGGEAVWGNHTWAPDDPPHLVAEGHTFGKFLDALVVKDPNAPLASVAADDLAYHVMRHVRAQQVAAEPIQEPMTSDRAIGAVQEAGGGAFAQQVAHYLGFQPVPEAVKASLSPAAAALVPMKDPLATPLPPAPGLSITCLHGVGLPTERSYHYIYVEAEDGSGGSWRINTEQNNATTGLDTGVRFSDGDATVPLLSLGYMCSHPWRSRGLNPAGLPVVMRQYQHAQGPPGVSSSADHVKIMSHHELVADLVELAAGAAPQLEERVLTDIHDIVARSWPGAALQRAEEGSHDSAA